MTKALPTSPFTRPTAAFNGEQCSVQTPQACSLNPERWVALLQLQAEPEDPVASGLANP